MMCKKCKQDKNIDNFQKNEIKRHSNICKQCCKDRKRIYYLKNKEKISKKTKQYYYDNHEKELEYRRNYKKNNKEQFKNYTKKYEKNINVRIKKNVNRRINRFIKTGGSSIQEFLPYTFIELKHHIENKFENWMNWDNYGTYCKETWDDNDPKTWKWQLDHIIPHSTFNYTSVEDNDFKKCWSLDNLRPYSAKQNILDGAR